MDTILVIEHHPANLVAQAMILRCFGYAVLEAENDNEAGRACHEHSDPIHLLLIGTTGAPNRDRELAGRLQSLRPEMRVLFHSNFSDSEVAGEELRRRGWCIVQRPVGVDSLARTIRDLLNDAKRVFRAVPGARE